jgi:8-amino-7-oxononanoate synthase
MSTKIIEKYKTHLDDLKSQNLYRQLKNINSEIIDLGSNDYLCLSKDNDVIENGRIYAKKYGCGFGSSRLIGDNSVYEELEHKISKTKGMDKTLIFNSGYQLNSSIISTLFNKDQDITIFCDKLNHASIYNGIEISGSKMIRYRNNDMNQLEDLLKKNTDKSNKVIITESVFSMDGNKVDVENISYLRSKYDAILYVDEAHAVGVIGYNGYGLFSSDNADIIVGTFGKALGSQGGYISCNKIIHDYLVNKCKGFIYSTGISPFIIGCVSKSWDKISSMKENRNTLQTNADYLRKNLKELGLNTLKSNTNIVPIIIGNDEKVINISQNLMLKNMHAPAIRAPTVAKNLSRLRVSLNISHNIEKINMFLDLLSNEVQI